MSHFEIGSGDALASCRCLAFMDISVNFQLFFVHMLMFCSEGQRSRSHYAIKKWPKNFKINAKEGYGTTTTTRQGACGPLQFIICICC